MTEKDKEFAKLVMDNPTYLGIHNESQDHFQLPREGTTCSNYKIEEPQLSMVTPTEGGFSATKITPGSIRDLREEIEWGVPLPDKDIRNFLNGFFRVSSSNQHTVLVPAQKWNTLSLYQKFQLFLTCNSNFAFAKEQKLWTRDFMMTITDEKLILEILNKKDDWVFLLTRLHANGPTESFEFVL